MWPLVGPFPGTFPFASLVCESRLRLQARKMVRIKEYLLALSITEAEFPRPSTALFYGDAYSTPSRSWGPLLPPILLMSGAELEFGPRGASPSACPRYLGLGRAFAF